MKKFLTLALALLLLTLAACADTPKEAQTNSAPPAEVTAEPTAVPTEAPTPEPTATPIPWVWPIGTQNIKLSQEAGEEAEEQTISVIGEYYISISCAYTLPEGFGCDVAFFAMTSDESTKVVTTWRAVETSGEFIMVEYIRASVTTTGNTLFNGIENANDEELYAAVISGAFDGVQCERVRIDGCPAIIFVNNDKRCRASCIIDGPDTVIEIHFVISYKTEGERDDIIQSVMDSLYNLRFIPYDGKRFD